MGTALIPFSMAWKVPAWELSQYTGRRGGRWTRLKLGPVWILRFCETASSLLCLHVVWGGALLGVTGEL